MCQPNRFSLILLLGLIASFVVADAIPLVLFEDTNFKGVRTEYRLLRRLTSCVNLRGKLNDFFSSVQNVEPNACFLLCEHEFCRGRCVQLSGSVTNLNALGFNDMTSSIRRCSTDATTSSSSIPSPTPTDPQRTPDHQETTTNFSTTGSSQTRDSSLVREDLASSTTTFSRIDASSSSSRPSSASHSPSSPVRLRSTSTPTPSSHRRR